MITMEKESKEVLLFVGCYFRI